MYSMYIGIIGRSKGSTVDSLAYRAGVKLECPLTGEIFNRESKDVEDVILSLPKDAPDWSVGLKDLIKEDRTKGVQEFCTIVEGAENRKDSQVYREFRLSLPREFTKEQSKELVKEFLDDQVCSHGITALQNYHFDVDKVTGEENPHCHVLLLTRRLTETGLGLKERSWNTKKQHEQWRSQWASYGNYHLLKNGLEANWDHRSYKDRGIKFEPQPKLGSKIIKMEMQAGQDPKNIYSTPVTERGREYQEVKLRNLYTLINRPEEALDAISKQQTTFMWGDVAKLLGRYVDDQALFNRLSLKIQQSSELVCLEDNGSYTRNVFTTQTRLAEEGKFIETLKALKENKSHAVEDSVVEKEIHKATSSLQKDLGDSKATLSSDQIKSIKHMALPDQLSFVEGYAGAGKTTVMKVMNEIWEESGYQVFGLAPTGKAAENLADCGISSNTVQSFLKSFENGRSQYDSQTVLVLDEAGMVDGRCFGDLIKAVEKLGVKLVASGDLGQLSPVEAGIPFRIAIKEVGKADLTTVLRQKIEWQREATVLFGEGRAAEALKRYDDKGLIKTVDEKYSALNDVANQKIAIEAQLRKVSKTIRARGVSDKNPANVNALFDQIENLNQENTFVNDLVHQKDHKGVVALYNLSRRVSGNISSEIRQDIEKDKIKELAVEQANLAKGIKPSKQKKPSFIERFYAHKDSAFFSEWQGIRKEASSVMVNDIGNYRSLMHELGVDGVDLCRKYNGYDKELEGYDEDKAHELAKDLGIDWRGTAKHLCDPRLDTKKEMVSAWFKSTELNPKDTHTMMSYSNKDVQHLNAMARDKMRATGVLGKEEYIYTIERTAGDDLGKQQFVNEERRFSVGDQIVFTQIDKGLGVKNGTLGRVTALSKDNIEAVIKKNGEDKVVSFSPNLYKRFDNGWAVTLHKNQGVTVDWAFVLSSFEQYKNLTYVAMTRHSKNVQMFVSKVDFWRKEKVFERLDRHQDKLAAMDYVSGDELLSLLKSDEKNLNSSLKKVGQKFEAIGYVGQRAFSTVCDKFLRRTPETNLIRVSQDITENLKSEADRADEKFRPVVQQPSSKEKRVGDHGQALGPQQAQPQGEIVVKDREVGRKKTSSNENSQLRKEINIGSDASSSLSLKKDKGVVEEGSEAKKLTSVAPEKSQDNKESRAHRSDSPIAARSSPQEKEEFDFKATAMTGASTPQSETINTKNRTEAQKPLTKTEKFTLADRALKSCDTVSLSKDVLRKYGHSEARSNSRSVAFRDGKLIYNLSGQYEGSVHCYKTGKTTPLFQKLREEKGLDFKGALSYILPYCRGSVVQDVESYLKGKKIRESSPEEIKAHKAAEEAFNKKREVEHKKDLEQKAAGIQSCIMKSVSIKGTPAEAYLRNERGIKGELSESLRYLPPKSSFTYGEKKPYVKTGALVSIAKTLDGNTKAIQLTYLTSEGKRCVDDKGKKFIKATYGSPTGAFVELQKGDSKSPIILAEGVETALSVKETGLKGSYYCSLGIANIDNLDVKGRDIIIAGDWDGNKETKSWKQTEKAKVVLEEKGNRVQIILPVETAKNSDKKLDFNDLLTSGGVKSIQSLIERQVPGLMASSLLPRENQSEQTNEKTQVITSNEAATSLPQPEGPTKHVKTQEKPVEQSAEVSDGEKLKENIVAYIEKELSLEKNKYFNKENVFKHVDADPLDYLKWWQDKRGGAPFDPNRPLEEQQPVSQNTPKNISESLPERGPNALSLTDDFVKRLGSLDDVIKALSDSNRSPEKLDRYLKERETKLLDINDKSVVMNDLKERYPEVADRAIQLKQERQRIQHQEQQATQSQGLER